MVASCCERSVGVDVIQNQPAANDVRPSTLGSIEKRGAAKNRHQSHSSRPLLHYLFSYFPFILQYHYSIHNVIIALVVEWNWRRAALACRLLLFALSQSRGGFGIE
jgi:hypothetical protein